MGKMSISPKWESAEELSRRVMIGDSDALTRLSRLSDEAEDDDDIESYISAFDDAAIAYAIGLLSDDENSWSEFRQVIRFYDARNDLQSDLANIRERERSIRFEISVLEEAVATAANEDARAHFAEELEMTRYALQFSQQEISQMEMSAEHAGVLYTIGKKKLSHARFTVLPDDVLDTLVDAVGFRLSDLEPDDNDNADDADGEEKDDLDDGECRANPNRST